MAAVVLIAATLATIAAWHHDFGSASADQPDGAGTVINVNSVDVSKVRYHGQEIPLTDLKNTEAAVTVIAPLSAQTGYIWAFDNQAEADRFNSALIELERNCWVPGTCIAQPVNPATHSP